MRVHFVKTARSTQHGSDYGFIGHHKKKEIGKRKEFNKIAAFPNYKSERPNLTTHERGPNFGCIAFYVVRIFYAFTIASHLFLVGFSHYRARLLSVRNIFQAGSTPGVGQSCAAACKSRRRANAFICSQAGARHPDSLCARRTFHQRRPDSIDGKRRDDHQ
jgi:hypothetical protein